MNTRAFSEFEELWRTLDGRLRIIPGKTLLKRVNQHLQGEFGVSISSVSIASCMSKYDVPTEIRSMLSDLNNFSKLRVDE